MSDLGRVLAVLALVAANAFLVIGEYSVVTARRARLAGGPRRRSRAPAPSRALRPADEVGARRRVKSSRAQPTGRFCYVLRRTIRPPGYLLIRVSRAHVPPDELKTGQLWTAALEGDAGWHELVGGARSAPLRPGQDMVLIAPVDTAFDDAPART